VPSQSVSRRHCRLRLDGDRLIVEDLGSVNGTFLNGELLTGPSALHDGDRFRVGPVTFRVEWLGGAVVPPPPPKPQAARGPSGRPPPPPPPQSEPEDALLLPLSDEPEEALILDDEPADALVLSDDQPTNLDTDGAPPWRTTDPGQIRDLLLELDADGGEPAE
jgi:predicted component of type VI protein secretion system